MIWMISLSACQVKSQRTMIGAFNCMHERPTVDIRRDARALRVLSIVVRLALEKIVQIAPKR
jgi:hypothetical protein